MLPNSHCNRPARASLLFDLRANRDHQQPQLNIGNVQPRIGAVAMYLGGTNG